MCQGCLISGSDYPICQVDASPSLQGCTESRSDGKPGVGGYPVLGSLFRGKSIQPTDLPVAQVSILIHLQRWVLAHEPPKNDRCGGQNYQTGTPIERPIRFPVNEMCFHLRQGFARPPTSQKTIRRKHAGGSAETKKTCADQQAHHFEDSQAHIGLPIISASCAGWLPSLVGK